MSQNRSSAVMQQRQEAADSLDDFPTAPWGTRALVEHVLEPLALSGPGNRVEMPNKQTCWESACNRGYMARPLQEYFRAVYASDVHDYGWDRMNGVQDFLFHGSRPEWGNSHAPDWVITNPPFRLAEQFIARSLAITSIGCAMLVRTSFVEGVGRYDRLFSKTPPTVVAQFVERLPMVKGRVDPKASTATSYAWLVWKHGIAPQPFAWIRPCRKNLERPGDYDALPLSTNHSIP